MRASLPSPLHFALPAHSRNSSLSCPMSTPITSGHRSASSEQSSRRDSSPSPRHESSVPRSTSNHTSPTRTSSPLPSPNKSWHQSYLSFQTLTRSQCPRVHYHPWCEDCQTLATWEQPLPTKPTYKKSIPTFGDLKTVIWARSHYQSPSGSPSTSQTALRKVCSTWRDEQFARAIAKRSTKMAAWEALRRTVHWQRTARGAAPPVI